MVSTNDKYKKKLLIQPDAGLGNRLYCLYSAFFYAKGLNRSFDVIWLRENCCNVGFDELFDKESFQNINIKTTYHLGYKSVYALRTIASNIYMLLLKKKYSYFNSEQTRQIFNEGGEGAIFSLLGKDENICIKANGKFFDLDDFAMVRDDIKPAKDICQMVDDIIGDCDKEQNLIGVHIRRTDNINSIKNSPIEAFESIMDEEVRSNPNTVFYLATDDTNVEEDFGKRYKILPHKTFGATKSRNSSSGIKDAYVDMLCLSRCNKIYGSFGSSFSEMAALIGDKPIEIVSINKNA